MIFYVRVVMEPPLLADLISRSIEGPSLQCWRVGDPPAVLTVVQGDTRVEDPTLITVVLPLELDQPLVVVIGDTTRTLSPTYPHALHDLLLGLASAAGSSSDCNFENSVPTASRS